MRGNHFTDLRYSVESVLCHVFLCTVRLGDGVGRAGGRGLNQISPRSFRSPLLTAILISFWHFPVVFTQKGGARGWIVRWINIAFPGGQCYLQWYMAVWMEIFPPISWEPEKIPWISTCCICKYQRTHTGSNHRAYDDMDVQQKRALANLKHQLNMYHIHWNIIRYSYCQIRYVPTTTEPSGNQIRTKEVISMHPPGGCHLWSPWSPGGGIVFLVDTSRVGGLDGVSWMIIAVRRCV